MAQYFIASFMTLAGMGLSCTLLSVCPDFYAGTQQTFHSWGRRFFYGAGLTITGAIAYGGVSLVLENLEKTTYAPAGTTTSNGK